MSIILRILLLTVSLVFLAYTLYKVRKYKYLLKYALVWIFLSIAGVICAIFPEAVGWISSAIGFDVTSNFVYFVLIGFLLVWNLLLCGVLSRLENTVKMLVQETSLEKHTHQDARQLVDKIR